MLSKQRVKVFQIVSEEKSFLPQRRGGWGSIFGNFPNTITADTQDEMKSALYHGPEDTLPS